ncbi:MAG: hypothetical protein ACI8PZ_001356 [Myxococcota bacterium]|jgi:hypothetical protein
MYLLLLVVLGCGSESKVDTADALLRSTPSSETPTGGSTPTGTGTPTGGSTPTGVSTPTGTGTTTPTGADSASDTGAGIVDTAPPLDTGPTTTDPDDTIRSIYQVDCPDPTTLRVRVETNFQIGDAVINFWDVLPGAAGWDEEHVLVEPPTAGRAGDDFAWHLLDESPWVSGLSSAFICGEHDGARMVYAIRAYDTDGNYEDCAIVGPRDHVDQVLAHPTGGGDVTGYNGVTRSEQINDVKCNRF